MNERDFDHIFRRKIEQIPNALPDDMIWQQLDNQLNSQVSSSTKWWKASSLLLLLALLGSNFYLWKKLDDLATLGAVKKVVQIDTIQKRSTVYQTDTVVKYVYIKEKNREYVVNTHKNVVEVQNLDDVKNKNNTSEKIENEALINSETSNSFYKKETKEIAKRENNTSAEKEKITTVEVKNKTVPSEKTLVNEAINNVVSIPQKIAKDSILITDKNTTYLTETKFDSLMQKIDNQSIVNKEENKEDVKIPTKIEPVKDKKLKNWTLGINTQSGVLDQKNGHGFFNGVGLSLATHFSPKWRIRTNIDLQEIDFDNRNDKDFYKHPKPNTKPDDTIVKWKIRSQPLAQWTIGIERLFNYKKLEFFVGVGTGVTFVFPHEVRYDGKNSIGEPINYNEDTKDTYSAFAGFQGSLGLSFPIYKKISATLSTHYQYNSNTEKLYWQNQLSGRLGLNYRF